MYQNKKEIRKLLTREYLESRGVKLVFDENEVPHILINGKENAYMPSNYNKWGYLKIRLDKLDENGNKIKVYNHGTWKSKPKSHYVYKQETFYLSRVIWAMYYGMCPANLVIDHIDNKCDRLKLESYKLDNLQIITHAENLTKDKNTQSKKILKHKFYTKEELDNILLKLENEYNKYMILQDQDKLHKIRASKCYYRKVKRGFGYE